MIEAGKGQEKTLRFKYCRTSSSSVGWKRNPGGNLSSPFFTKFTFSMLIIYFCVEEGGKTEGKWSYYYWIKKVKGYGEGCSVASFIVMGLTRRRRIRRHIWRKLDSTFLLLCQTRCIAHLNEAALHKSRKIGFH